MIKSVIPLLVLFTALCSGCTNRDIADGGAHKPANIIFMVGDGMGLTQITAGMYANGNSTVFERFEAIGLQKTQAADDLITDSAASATAFSTGEKTYNAAIAVDVNKKPLKTIFEECHDRNVKTGIAVTSTITHATPASYYAHNEQRSNYEEIAADLADSKVSIAIGYGLPFFNNRKDKRDLIGEMESGNWAVYENIGTTGESSDIDQVAVLLNTKDAPPVEGRPLHFLRDASLQAIDHLKSQPFMLLVEGSQIDWAGHANNSNWIISEMADFEETIEAVLDWAEAEGNTLVVVTADHETGGYGINGGTADSLSTGFTTGHHTATMIPVFAKGPGAELFTGIYENTEIYTKMRQVLGWGSDRN